MNKVAFFKKYSELSTVSTVNTVHSVDKYKIFACCASDSFQKTMDNCDKEIFVIMGEYMV